MCILKFHALVPSHLTVAKAWGNVQKTNKQNQTISLSWFFCAALDEPKANHVFFCGQWYSPKCVSNTCCLVMTQIKPDWLMRTVTRLPIAVYSVNMKLIREVDYLCDSWWAKDFDFFWCDASACQSVSNSDFGFLIVFFTTVLGVQCAFQVDVCVDWRRWVCPSSYSGLQMSMRISGQWHRPTMNICTFGLTWLPKLKEGDACFTKASPTSLGAQRTPAKQMSTYGWWAPHVHHFPTKTMQGPFLERSRSTHCTMWPLRMRLRQLPRATEHT